MKRYLKTFSYILIAAFFSVALSGCTKKESSTDPNAKKVIVWSFEDSDIWKPIKESFETNNEGYELVYIKQTLDDDYENRVLNSVLSGQGPDVWSMPNDWVSRHKDKLAPMPEKMATQINMDDEFVPVIKQSVVFNNQIYALSPSAQPLMVYYNDKAFETALDNYFEANPGDENKEKRNKAAELMTGFPKTWDDFVEVTKMITRKNGANIDYSGTSIGTDKSSSATDLLYLLMLQNETKILSENMELATFNLPKDTPKNTTDIPGKRALEFFTSFADPTSPNYAWNDSLGDPVEAFAQGKTAMIFDYSDLQYYYSQKYPNLHYKKAFVPQLSAEPSKIVDYAKFNAFGVSNLSTKSTIAWNLINDLVYKTFNDYDSALDLYHPLKESKYNVSLDARDSNNPEQLSLATAQTVVKGRYPIDFDQNIKNAIFAVNNKIQDPKSALDLAANNITELLRKTSW